MALASFKDLCVDAVDLVRMSRFWTVTVDAPSGDALVAHGATVLRTPDDHISWSVLADPEGNEFCVFPAGE